MRYSFLLLCLLILTSTYSQRIAVGAGPTIGCSLPGKIGTRTATQISRLNVGLHTSVRYQINRTFSLYSGLNIVRKTSMLKHHEYDFPNLSHTGGFKFGMRNRCIQIPLLFSVSLHLTDSSYFELLAGLNATIMIPTAAMFISGWDARYDGTGPLQYSAVGYAADYKKKYGLEMNVGLAYNFKRNAESKRMRRIALGMERTFFAGPRINYEIVLSNDTQVKKYTISENPILWYFKLEYTYFFFLR